MKWIDVAPVCLAFATLTEGPVPNESKHRRPLDLSNAHDALGAWWPPDATPLCIARPDARLQLDAEHVAGPALCPIAYPRCAEEPSPGAPGGLQR
jgi:hypothetical protein